jgi:protoporphyrinogen oxidase
MDIIIGAGISGISYANFTKNDYLIIEADKEIGGYCKTVKQDGFTWDYSGHFFHFQNKWIEELVCKNINRADILTCEKHSQIKYKDIYVDFPFQKNIHQLEKDELIDCLYDLFTVPKIAATTFKQMLYAKFGKSIAEKFLIPYNEKLYACNLDDLDVNAMGRFFPYADKEDIVNNFRHPDNKSYNAYFTYPKGGAIEYIQSLYANIDPGKVLLDEPVTAVDLKSKEVITGKRRLRYDNLISTIPFNELLGLSAVEFDERVYSSNKVLVFNFGFDKKGDDRVNNWVYFPDKNCCFYRVGYYDNIFKDDRMSIYVELGFDRHVGIDVAYYKRKVIEDLKSRKIVTDQTLISEHHVIMNPAYVNITDASQKDVAEKKRMLQKNAVYSIGRYGSWTYCSIEDNIIEAKKTAERIPLFRRNPTLSTPPPPDFHQKTAKADLIVKFHDIPVEDYADNYFDFKFSLQDMFKRPVDLLEEQAMRNPYFIRHINRKKELIYCHRTKHEKGSESLTTNR